MKYDNINMCMHVFCI